jgi:hypothetical protein
MRFRMPSPATVLSFVAVFVVLGGSAFAAGSLLTGADIKDQSLTGKDIKPGSVGMSRLTKGAQALMQRVGGSSLGASGVNGADGAQGPKGETGAAGAKGATGDKGAKGDTGAAGTNGTNGAAGTNGTNGAAGTNGTNGTNGADALTKVTALPQHGWDKREGTCDGTTGAPVGSTSFAGGHVQFGPLTDGNMYAGITMQPTGVKLGDIAYLAYSTHYTQTTDQHGGAPYVTVKTESGAHSYAFSPNTQPGRHVTADMWQRWTVTESTIRRDDDAGGPGPDPSWEDIVSQYAGETVSRISIIAGCAGGYSDGTTAQVDNVETDIAGTRSVYDFG